MRLSRNHTRQWILWGCTALWMGVIFFFSSQTGDSSGALSGDLIDSVLPLVYPPYRGMGPAEQTSLVDFWQFFVRKSAHFTVYMVLGLLTSLAAVSHPLRERFRVLLPLAICLLYAAGDEFHQSFVPGRGPQLRDVAIDFCGAALGVILITLCRLLWRRRGKKRNRPTPSPK